MSAGLQRARATPWLLDAAREQPLDCWHRDLLASGRNVVRRLVAQGDDPVPASPSTGVDTITGEGLVDVMVGR